MTPARIIAPSIAPPDKCDLRIQLNLDPKVTRKWDFFWVGLMVMLWGFAGFRRAMVKRLQKRNER